MTDSPEAVMARARVKSWGADPDSMGGSRTISLPENVIIKDTMKPLWISALPRERNIIAALRAAGYAIVPVEPTKAMRQIGGETNCPTETLTSACDYAVGVYRAMLAAFEDTGQ